MNLKELLSKNERIRQQRKEKQEFVEKVEESVEQESEKDQKEAKVSSKQRRGKKPPQREYMVVEDVEQPE